MTTRLALACALAVGLCVPATAAAGGFATVGVDPPPDGIAPGTPWHAQLTILQHGVTPLEGVQPRVIASSGDTRRVFPARATDAPGVYRADVVFPSAGTWRYVVDDGFTARHSFAPVEVRRGGAEVVPAERPATAAPTTGGDAGPDLLLALGAAAVAGLAAALASTALQRRGPRPAVEGG
jgi:hypothetical protein